MPDDPLSSSRPAAVPPTTDVSTAAADIAVRIDAPAWLEALPYLATLASEVCADTMASVLAGSADSWPEVSLVFADDDFVASLNATYRGKSAPTNVLSFPAADEPDTPDDIGEPLLGDVVLAFETTQSEAAAQGKPLADHVAHLVVHGVLHLLGHDHESKEDAEKMEALEVRILAGLGISDPYESTPGAQGEDSSTTDEGGAHVQVP